MLSSHYIIRGGIEGRERLRLLARVMHPTTLQLLERAGVTEGMACLDVGCGGGDVTLNFAKVVGPKGRAVGTDIDNTKLDMARSEAADRGSAMLSSSQSTPALVASRVSLTLCIAASF